MAMNPMQLLKLKDRLTVFRNQHPKVVSFFRAVGTNGVQEGSIIEIKLTDQNGGEHVTNMKVTKEDIETIRMLRDMNSK